MKRSRQRWTNDSSDCGSEKNHAIPILRVPVSFTDKPLALHFAKTPARRRVT